MGWLQVADRSKAIALIETQVQEADRIEAEQPDIIEGEVVEVEEAPIAGSQGAQNPTQQQPQTQSNLGLLRNAIIGSALLQQASQAVKGLKYDSSSQLKQIPMPGSIAVPLGILLFLLLVLIPYNGHTRLRWLWLAITGNAHIDIGKAVDVTATPSNPGLSMPGGQGGPGFNTNAKIPQQSGGPPPVTENNPNPNLGVVTIGTVTSNYAQTLFSTSSI